MGYPKTRYYNITVTASDAAGNTGSDTCRVVIVPTYDSDSKSSKAETYVSDSKSGKTERYYSISAVDASVDESEVLYEAAQVYFGDSLALSHQYFLSYFLSQPINCKKPEAKLNIKGNCKECCSGKCNRKKTKCQKVP